MSTRPGIPPAVTAAAEATMASTCTISRASGPAAFDPATHAIEAASVTTIYAGQCTYSSPRQVQRSRAGEDDRTVTSRNVSIPATATPPRSGDLVSIEGLDPLVVDVMLGGTHRVRRRFSCVATTDAPGVPA